MRRVPEFLAAELLSQLAILLFDWEEFEWSAAITAKAMRLYRRARPFREDTGFKEARLARAQKRDALSAAVPVGGTRRARAIAAVREARSDADHRGDRQGTMSALYVEAVLWEATGAARKSVERAEEALTFRASADAFTEANTRALLARGLHRLGEPARARQQLADSLRIANRHDIILSPAVVDGAVLRVGGREAFGMGHRPMFSVRRRGDSPFRHEMLNEFVEALGG
jgi:hypothetical protein